MYIYSETKSIENHHAVCWVYVDVRAGLAGLNSSDGELQWLVGWESSESFIAEYPRAEYHPHKDSPESEVGLAKAIDIASSPIAAQI